jgi:hypothetical protein
MKRSQAISKIASTLINYRTADSYLLITREYALEVAETILTIQEELGIIKPTHKKTIIRRDIEAMPYEDFVEVSGWEKE